MISRVAVTHQMDDPNAAARELTQGILSQGPLAKHSAGIVFCYSDTDLDAFMAALSPLVSFDVIGASCIASIDSGEGFHELAATLLVLSADDCDFSMALSEPITPENAAARVKETCAQAIGALPEAPKLMVAIAPYDLNIMLDEFTEALNQAAPGVPVVGGLPSYNGSGDTIATLFGGNVYPDRMVLLAISGGIRPVFSVQNVAGSIVERKRKVTEARDNTVYRVGNQTFVEYMKDVGFPVDSLTGGNDTITFVSNPILLENVSLAEGDGFSFVRTLHKVDVDEGSGTAIGKIPMDATLSICSLEKRDIATAAGIGMRDLKDKMAQVEAEGYAFTTLLAVSCIGRYLVMAPDGGTEAREILEGLPKGLTLAGFYGYGEIGPLAVASGSVNFAHNESLVLCAL